MVVEVHHIMSLATIAGEFIVYILVTAGFLGALLAELHERYKDRNKKQ